MKSARIYLVPQEDGTLCEICVQSFHGYYRPWLFTTWGSSKGALPTAKKFDTIEDCQAFIDCEALANGWQRAIVGGRVLY